MSLFSYRRRDGRQYEERFDQLKEALLQACLEYEYSGDFFNDLRFATITDGAILLNGKILFSEEKIIRLMWFTIDRDRTAYIERLARRLCEA